MSKSKKPYESYGAALAALINKGGDPAQGSVYHCDDCDAYHTSSRRFTLAKPRGRGGTRRGVVYKRGS